MWLQLSAALAAEPEVSAAARGDAYDDGWISVASPSARVRAALARGWTVQGAWSSDFVSGATPHFATDTMSSATRFTEERHGGSVDVERRLGPAWTVGAAATLSGEHDSGVGTVGARASTDVLDAMATARVAYTLRVDQVGRVDDAAYTGNGIAHTVDAGWTAILGRTTRGSLLATFTAESCSSSPGCEASPYRLVRADGVPVPERHPGELDRAAVALRGAQAIGRRLALHAGARVYADSWSVIGHTEDLRLALSLADDRWLVHVGGRYAGATPAAFAAASYSGLPEWRTSDRELMGESTVLAGGGFAWTPPAPRPLGRVSLSGRLDHLWLSYSVAGVPSREAWVGGGGIDVDF